MQVLDAIPPVACLSLRVVSFFNSLKLCLRTCHHVNPFVLMLLQDNSTEFRRKLVLDLILDDNNKEKEQVINKLNQKP